MAVFRIRIVMKKAAIIIRGLFFSLILPLVLPACDNQDNLASKDRDANEAPISNRLQKAYESSQPIQPKTEYTNDAPEEWAGLEDEHLPVVSFARSLGHDIIVRVNLKNPGGDHYIEKIAIVDKNGKELVYKVFRRHDRFFEAQFFSSKLPSDKEGLKVYAKCSLHDLWSIDFPVQEKNRAK